MSGSVVPSMQYEVVVLGDPLAPEQLGGLAVLGSICIDSYVEVAGAVLGGDASAGHDGTVVVLQPSSIHHWMSLLNVAVPPGSFDDDP
jgi:hypothetical protein